jgi:molybdenum cofactor cytidylyltransferase
MNNISAGVIILAAGSSRRMGRPKLLLPWGDTSVLGHLIGSWRHAGARQIGVVCAKQIQAVADELDRLQFASENRIFNPDPDRGMFSSIQCAAAWPGWQSGLTHWAIVLGDQPHLQTETLRGLLEFGAGHSEKICQPMRNGRRRHPVLLPRKAFLALADTAAADLKSFLQSRPDELAGFEAEDPGLDFDMDVPADYERARKLYLEKS